MKKLVRITTVPISLRGLLGGQHKYMSKNGFEVIGVSSPGEILDDVREREGIQTVAIEMTRKITPVKDFRALIQLIRLMKRERPDIVHTHTPKAGLLGMMAAKITGVPYRLHTVAGMPLTVAKGVRRQLLNVMERITYACATKIYPNSNGLKDLILEYKFTNESKLKVIGKGSSNGIDTSVFDPELVSEEEKNKLREELGIKKDDFVFLFVGRVVTDKGINELVKAFYEISKHNKSIKLILVGGIKDNDPILDSTKETIKRNDSIISTGTQRNVVPYYSISDVFVFPSYREGFPNVVMEAAAMQLNCIVSDINGCNEIITNKENGLIIPAQNTDDLQRGMQWCFENKEISKKMGLKSRMNMQKDFERSFVQEELLKEYKGLMKIN